LLDHFELLVGDLPVGVSFSQPQLREGTCYFGLCVSPEVKQSQNIMAAVFNLTPVLLWTLAAVNVVMLFVQMAKQHASSGVDTVQSQFRYHPGH
jgi:hypothetical protein